MNEDLRIISFLKNLKGFTDIISDGFVSPNIITTDFLPTIEFACSITASFTTHSITADIRFMLCF